MRPLFGLALADCTIGISSANTIIASISCAFASNTTRVSGRASPTTTGVPCFMIPAFSYAIFDNVLPKNWVWSSEMLVMMESKGLIMLVQSNRPPKPTSIMAKSTCCSEKYLKAIAVVSSKNDGCNGSKKLRWFSTKSITYCSEIILPFTLMRSLKSTRCGLV